MISTKYHSFEEFAAAEYSSGVKGKAVAQLMYMYRKAIEKNGFTVLELGTAKGASTTVFLQACEERDGRLVSVDIVDCSDVSDSSRWRFIQADSTDLEFILSEAPYLKNGIDFLYIDSMHRREHVEKELMTWYPYLNEQSWIFFDDIDSNPYRRGNRKDKFRTEIAIDEIHEYVKSFFYANEDNLHLNILYGSTGLACLHKLSSRGDLPRKAGSIIHRRKSSPQFIVSSIKSRIARYIRYIRKTGN